MRSTLRALAFAIPSLFGSNLSPAYATPFLYLTQDGSSINAIHRIDVAGGSLETIRGSGLLGPIGVDVALAAGKVYWTDQNLGLVERRNLDGSGPVETLISGEIGPHDIALDVPRGKLYFADRGTPSLDASLKRADLDGGNLEIIISGIAPAYLEVDPISAKIYYSHGARISRANLDGTGAELIHSAATDTVRGIALDLFRGEIYFGLVGQLDGSFRIAKADLDGTNTQEFLPGLPEWPHDLAIDPVEELLYWSFSEGVHRVRLDLSGGIETVVSGLQGSSAAAGVNGIALGLRVVPEPATGLLLTLGLAVLAVMQRKSA
jgi:low density lipoprotein receptor-related protein 5/6